jgi:hypothetical protein
VQKLHGNSAENCTEIVPKTEAKPVAKLKINGAETARKQCRNCTVTVQKTTPK